MIREVDEDGEDHEKNDATGVHQPRVCNRPCALRFDSRHGSECGDNNSETKPNEPIHSLLNYKIQAMRRRAR
jgi:hypothetical protein